MRLIWLAAGVGVIALAVVLWLVVGGDDIAPLESKALEGAAARHSVAADVLADAGLGAERLCVFGPYISDSEMMEHLGFEWPGAAKGTGIYYDDSHSLVVATTATRVMAWARVPRLSGLGLVWGSDSGCEDMRR